MQASPVTAAAPKPAPPRRPFRSLLEVKTSPRAQIPLLLQEAIVSLVMAVDEVERLASYCYARDHHLERVALLCTRSQCLRWTSAKSKRIAGFRQLVGHVRRVEHTAADFQIAPVNTKEEHTR